MKPPKASACPHDGKPCERAHKCTLSILEVCATCTETFASRHFACVGSCAECRALREKKRTKNAGSVYGECKRDFLCIIRDAEEVERRGRAN